jgi:hypothetical protein
VVLILHPFEVVPHDDDHPLAAFSIDTALRNLDAILDHLESGGVCTRVVTLSEAARRWRQDHA